MAAGTAGRASLAVLLLGAGCSPPEEAEAAPSAWTWEGEAPADAPTADELSVGVQALVDSLLDVTAGPVISSYYEAMSYGFDWCPELAVTSSEATGDMTYWDGMCQGDASVWFKGPMTTWTWDGIDLGAGSVDIISEIMASSPSFEGYTFYGGGIRGQTDIFNPDSSVDFNCSCTAMQGYGTAEDGRIGFFSFMDGPSHWTGSAAEATWMAEGVRPGLWTWAETDPGTSLRHVTVAGNITGFTERFDTARLDLSVFHALGGSSACVADDLSSFSLYIRDAETADWLELPFTIEPSAESCTAAALYGDGAVEVELAGLVAWEDRPW